GDIANQINGSSSSQVSQSTATSSGSHTMSTVECSNVSLAFTTNYDTLMKFLDAVKKSGRTAKVSTLTVATAASGNVSVVVSIDCYGIEKLDSSDSLTNPVTASSSGKDNPFK
ncbi:MAG: hypothetical protein P4M02_01025, partial [Clostridia bacterium]|nr:hypothetical protein [Clostridia bacterium]